MAPKAQQPRSEAPRIIREILLFPFTLIGIILILIASLFTDVEWTPADVYLLSALIFGTILTIVGVVLFAPS